MSDILFTLVKWSEVWALFIPLTIILLYRIKAKEMQPVILYVFIGLALNIPSVIISEYGHDLPTFLQNNNLLYNINCVARVVLFGIVITKTSLIESKKAFQILIPLFIIFVAVNFIFLESPFNLSQKLATLENILLLAICVSFLLLSISDDSDIIWIDHPAFLVCTAVSFYEAINFFVFLFFHTVAESDMDFSRATMIIFSVSHFIFNTILAVALYRFRDPQQDRGKPILTSKPSV